MNLISNLAATYSTSSYSYPSSSYYTTTSANSEVAAAAVAGVMVFYVIFGIALYVVQSIFMMQMFKKAKVAAWKAWVPFVNAWTFLQVGGQKGYWIFAGLAGFVLCMIIAAVTGATSLLMGGANVSSTAIGASAGVGIVLAYIVLFAGAVVQYVFQCIAAYNIGKKLKFNDGMVVLYIFFSIIWLGIAGLGKSTYDDKQGKPNLAPTVK